MGQILTIINSDLITRLYTDHVKRAASSRLQTQRRMPEFASDGCQSLASDILSESPQIPSSEDDVFRKIFHVGERCNFRSFRRSVSHDMSVNFTRSFNEVYYTRNASSSTHFPIAIVGIGCRMPGNVNGTEDFWDVLTNGRNVIGDIPPDRWSMDAYHNPDPSSLGTHVNKKSGFIDGIDQFDNGFFKISPKEAAMMDPQQRHLLEVTQEAFDDAGILSELLKENCGVYVGIGMMDYPLMLGPESQNFNAYAHTGVAHSVAANRLSFAFNLKGPSVAVDTACAASMTALHFGCQALWNKECSVSLVAGSNVLLMPEVTAGFSALSVLSPEGLSCPFDKDAKGYVRSEGFGAIIIKPLSQALQDGDNIYCTIVGSGIAANGTSPSITMPSCEAQVRLMESVYGQFNIDPQKLIYVEAHGTGTPVGDPIEAEAIGTALAQERNSPLRIGSAKSNFGHMECCAGLVSIIKAALMIKKHQLCPSINYSSPIDSRFDEWNIEVQQKVEDFPPGRKHLIGVNNYGFGGALAHAIIGDYSITHPRKSGQSGWKFGQSDTKGKELLIPLSAKTEEALIDLAKEWSLFESEKDAEGIVGWMASRRSHHAYRLAVTADSGQSFQEKLQSFVSNRDGVLQGAVRHSQTPPKICFLFPGQGQQDKDMGRQLYATEPVFRDTIDECDRLYTRLAGESILKLCGLFVQQEPDTEFTGTVNDIDVSQPAILFMQLGLIDLWRHWGVLPDVVIGHSFGELAAAVAAGLLTKREATEIVFHRCQLQKRLKGKGTMAALRMDRESAEELLKKYEGIVVSCINSPASVTVAGDVSSVKKLIADNPTVAKQLRVQCAFHTNQMDEIETRFMRAVDGKQAKRSSKIPFYSSVTGLQQKSSLDAKYWWNNVRHPVNFLGGLRSLLEEQDVDVVIECSSAATLLSCVQQTASDMNKNIPTLINSCLRGKSNRSTILKALGNLYISNVDLKWSSIYNHKAEWTPLPRYPWQHRAFWCEAESSRTKRLGLKDRSFKGNDGVISTMMFPFLKDHVIQGKIIFPGAGYLELVAETCLEDNSKVHIKNIMFKQILPLGDASEGHSAKSESVQLNCVTRGSMVSVHGPHAEHASCSIVDGPQMSKPTCIDKNFMDITSVMQEKTMEEIYQQFSGLGLQYGPAFQVIKKAWLSEGRSICELIPAKQNHQKLQVTTLDGCLQAALLSYGFSSGLYLPVAIKDLQLHCKETPINTPLYVVTELTDLTPSLLEADVKLVKKTGEIVMELKGFEAQNISIPSNDFSQCLYLKALQPKEAVLPDTSKLFDRLSWPEMKEDYPKDAESVLQIVAHADLLSKMSSTFASRAIEMTQKNEVQPALAKYYDCLQDVAGNETKRIEDLDAAFSLLRDQIPDFEVELRMFQRLGNLLPHSLKHPKSALEVLFASDGLAEYFLESLTTRLFYKVVRDMILEAVNTSLKEKSMVRIIEVGGRMGGLSKVVLEPLQKLMQDGRVEYIFTDLTRTFFLHAKQTLKDYPDVRYQELDIEKPITDQGFSDESCDIVICLDTLHAVVDIHNGLANMRDLLAPKGWLLMLEATETYNMREVIFGTLELCWIFKDFREKKCWLSQGEWKDIFTSNGFDNVIAGPEPDFFHSIILGQKGEQQAVKKSSPCHAVVFSSDKMKSADITSVIAKAAGSEPLSCYTVTDLIKHVEATNPCQVYCVFHEGTTEMSTVLDVLKEVGNKQSDIEKIWVIVVKDQLQLVYPNSEMFTGMSRVAINEFRSTPVFTVSLKTPHGLCTEAAETLEKLLCADNLTDREYSIENGKLHVPRVTRVDVLPSNTGNPENWYLAANGTGSVDSLVYCEQHLQQLKPNEVRIQVKSAAFNFKDVMSTMGMLKDLSDGEELGLECSGYVEDIGSQVTNFSVGDEVIALGTRCLASHVTAPEHFVCHKPKGVSFDEGCGVGIVFSTAYEALINKGNLKEGETILIHSAAGGVGQAAIQLANLIGANIICTAGTEDKRTFLKEHCGIRLVTDSRSLQFQEDVMNWTNGKGVDVILNSLSGDRLKAGLMVLGDGGRFCEIGKRDILEDSSLHSRVFLENKSFLSVQLDLLMVSQPQRVQQILHKVQQMMNAGVIQPIKTTSHGMDDVKTAFKTMMGGSHIGKIVMAIDDGYIPPCVSASAARFDSDAVYLVTGGTGGIGLSLLRWMAERGAEHIGVVTRKGFQTLEQKLTLNSLHDDGVHVLDLKIDMTSLEQVNNAITKLEESTGLPLKGVFHLSGVAEDDSILKLSQEKLKRVLDSKARSAMNLHLATESKNIDYFVMMSSITTVSGNIEQSAYISANVFLESLAQHRHLQGLPGLAIQLGAVTGAGILKSNMVAGEILKARGLLPLHVDEVVSNLDQLVQQKEHPVIAYANMNWNTLQTHVYEGCPQFTNLHKMSDGSGQDSDVKVSREDLALRVKKKLSSLLDMPESDVHLSRPMVEYGVDSLMAVEMVNWLNRELGITVSQLDILGGVRTDTLLDKACEGSVVLSA
ncbi:highly reducing polyketide synthase alt5-like [Gigantopelta aegis]|uniref:highly reducing polyketide synthase alt5-like n=1 Tax=Gigantopelta aegis TaxID=1735272 RepID=UPI001B88ADBA|nr:highly reducing polyketide synthase alt5-like [Gigantopelta aegis]